MRATISNLKLLHGDDVLACGSQPLDFDLTPGKYSVVPTLRAEAPWDAIGFELVFWHLPENFHIRVQSPDNDVPIYYALVPHADTVVNGYWEEDTLYIALERESGEWPAGEFELVEIEIEMSAAPVTGQSMLTITIRPRV
jgi:hypothetical protein